MIGPSRGAACCLAVLGLLAGLAEGEAGKEPESGFRQVFHAGVRDANGKLMGGTELVAIVEHGGELYATSGFSWDKPGEDPAPGAQILVLDRASGAWRLDYELPKKNWRASLASVTFTTDGHGRKLATPVSKLVAAPSDPGGQIDIYSRDDETQQWLKTPLASNTRLVSVRALFGYRDKVTGVDHIFAGTLPNGIYSGAYDPSVPGGIRWGQEPEFAGYSQRAMGFAECNGELYLSALPSLYKRIDGPSPRWVEAYKLSTEFHKASFGLRGLTAIPNPSGKGEVLLAALEGGPSRVVRIDPAAGFEETVELDVLDFLGRHWGRRPTYAIVAYNDVLALRDPATGKQVHLIGISATYAALKDEHPMTEWETRGWYLIRRDEGRYELRQILDPAASSMPDLVGTRTIALSPSGDGIVYFGGYDPNRNPSHNTAWIFAAPLSTVLGPPVRRRPVPQVSIMQIQGSSQWSPLKGRFVETSGVVTLVTARKDGFWLQDPAGDGDSATSDGVFVAAIPGVVYPEVGDSVRILGRVEEEQKGNELPRTRLYMVQSPETLSKGNPLPKPVPIVKLPDVSMAEGVAAWEALEGMRVSVENAPVISPTSRFREFDVLAPGNAVPGSGYHPETGRLIMRSLGGDQVDYDPERIMVGDATQEKPAVVSAGDHVDSLVGVADYTFGYYKVQPETLRLEQREIPKDPAVVRSGPAGNFVVTTYNLWDFFTAVPQGKNARYVLKPEELETRMTKIAKSVVSELELPHVLAVQEVEGANLEPLAQRINALSGARYQAAWLPTSDWRNLTIGFLYDSARVKLLKLFQLTGTETTAAFGQNSAIGNREPLVGVFEAGPGVAPVTVIANKAKTKRAEDSPFSLEPPFRFTEIQRKAQMREIRRFVSSLLAQDPEAYLVISGDLGDFAFAEPGEGPDHPLAILEGMEGETRMTNLVSRVEEAQRYDYIFQGAGTVVSHTLVSPALLQAVVGVDFLHFNSPFPDGLKWDASTPIRASDRDPLEVRFALAPRDRPGAESRP